MWIIGMLFIFAVLIAGTCAGMNKGVQIHNRRVRKNQDIVTRINGKVFINGLYTPDEYVPTDIVDQLNRL